MPTNKRFKLLVLVLLLCGSYRTTCAQDTSRYVLMVSFDGFRYDYVEHYHLRNFRKLIRQGTAAEYMIPSYPSKTFPNHYTLVTGLYPGNHGLVDNKFYDPASGKSYSSHNKQMVTDPDMYRGIPLWQLASREGLKSASYYWVGSEAPVAGRYPDYYLPYNHQTPNNERIDSVMSWLALPADQRPHLITLYFALIDDSGHDYGPFSPENKDQLQEADRLLGNLMKRIDRCGLPVNLIVVSDHGMYEMHNDPGTYIPFRKLMRPFDEQVIVVNSETHVHLYRQDTTDMHKVYRHFKENESHYTTYWRKDIPEKWHYREDPRVGDILLVADPGYSFELPEEHGTYGSHGYAPDATQQVAGIFYARGPQIKKGYRIPAFKNIHVYSLVARLLDLDLPPQDGDPKVLSSVIRDK